MDCRAVDEMNVIERYLNEALSEQDTQAFEEHYMSCARCFEEMQLKHAAAIELSRMPIAAVPRPGWAQYPALRWGLAAAAALVLVLVGLRFMRSPQETVKSTSPQAAEKRPDVATQIAQLSVVEQAPPYRAVPLRSAQSSRSPRFDAGMLEYSAGRYDQAVGPLSEAAQLNPDHVATAFYLGIAHLMANQPREAMENLLKVTASDNSYAEEARWYLAKAYLRQKDTLKAAKQLTAVIEAKDRYAADARTLLQKLEELGVASH